MRRARLSLADDEAARQAQLMEHNAGITARAKQTASPRRICATEKDKLGGDLVASYGLLSGRAVGSLGRA
jgi:hydrogenase maturation factor HypE